MCDANKCNNCMCWLKICKAECCKVFKINTNHEQRKLFKKIKKKSSHESITIKLPQELRQDEINYYEWRDIQVTNKQKLTIPIDKIRIEGIDVFIDSRCNRLMHNNLCGVHGTPEKPRYCTEFDETQPSNPKHYTTPNCLANFK